MKEEYTQHERERNDHAVQITNFNLACQNPRKYRHAHDTPKERKRAGDRMIIITAFNDKRYEWAFEHIFQLRQMKKKRNSKLRCE